MKGLSEAGYAKTSFKQKSLQTVIESGKGVYQLKHVKTQHGLSSMAGVTITSVDPGQVQIIQGVRAIGDFWSRSKVPELIDLGEHVSYSGSEYSEKTRSNIARQGEQKRRQINTEYSEAIAAMPRRDCINKVNWTDYCKAWAVHQHVYWKEKLNHHRKCQRFSRFRAVQSTLEDIAERIAPKRECGLVRKLVMFGAASFAAQKGCAAAPRKALIRVLCQRVPVIMVPEHYTSISCPGCGRETKTTDYRTKMCETTSAVQSCPLHPTVSTYSLDRDLAGSLNIGIKGVYSIAGVDFKVRVDT